VNVFDLRIRSIDLFIKSSIFRGTCTFWIYPNRFDGCESLLYRLSQNAIDFNQIWVALGGLGGCRFHGMQGPGVWRPVASDSWPQIKQVAGSQTAVLQYSRLGALQAWWPGSSEPHWRDLGGPPSTHKMLRFMSSRQILPGKGIEHVS
jgi:hypothetical protein